MCRQGIVRFLGRCKCVSWGVATRFRSGHTRLEPPGFATAMRWNCTSKWGPNAVRFSRTGYDSPWGNVWGNFWGSLSADRGQARAYTHAAGASCSPVTTNPCRVGNARPVTAPVTTPVIAVR